MSAYGYSLYLRTFALAGDRLTPSRLSPEPVDVGHGHAVTGWRAEPQVVWFACLAELLPDGIEPTATTITGNVGDWLVTLAESGGLALRLVQQPSGELVELYAQDWRTLPLIESPAYTCWPGDLAAAGMAARH